MYEIEKKEDISQAHDALQQVRMEEGTKDEINPQLKLQRDVLNRLKEEQGVIFDELKPLRKEADKGLDEKALNDDFRNKCKEALSEKKCGIYCRTAAQIYADFRTAKDRAFKEYATMRFHRFDGAGYFQFRCNNVGSVTDGVNVNNLLTANFKSNPRLHVENIDYKEKKSAYE